MIQAWKCIDFVNVHLWWMKAWWISADLIIKVGSHYIWLPNMVQAGNFHHISSYIINHHISNIKIYHRSTHISYINIYIYYIHIILSYSVAMCCQWYSLNVTTSFFSTSSSSGFWRGRPWSSHWAWWQGWAEGWRMTIHATPVIMEVEINPTSYHPCFPINHP